MDDDPSTPTEVVVGTDGTPTAAHAVAWAATEARVRGRSLRIVHAGPYAAEDHSPGRRRAAAILSRAHTVARRREPGLRVRTELSREAPVAALVHASRGADLLVVGLLGGHPGDLLVTSIAPPLTSRAHCPVTVVRSDDRLAGDGRPVVVGVEDVDDDAGALTVAFADAERHASPLVVVHAGHRSPGAPEPRLGGLERWRADRPRVPVEVRVPHGAAGEHLLRAAHGSRLLVLGTSGRNLAARAARGSVSRMLVRLAPCPVTIVRRDLDLPVPGTRSFDADVVGS